MGLEIVVEGGDATEAGAGGLTRARFLPLHYGNGQILVQKYKFFRKRATFCQKDFNKLTIKLSNDLCRECSTCAISRASNKKARFWRAFLLIAILIISHTEQRSSRTSPAYQRSASALQPSCHIRKPAPKSACRTRSLVGIL